MSSRLVALLVVVLAWTFSGCADPNEPKFEGRGLSSWRWDFRSSDPEKREKAAKAFSKIGPPALEDLTKAIKDEDPSVRSWAVIGLNEIAETEGTDRETQNLILEQLKIAIGDQSTPVRMNALNGLTALGEPGIKVIAASINEQSNIIKGGFIAHLEKSGRAFPDVVVPVLKEIYEKDTSAATQEAARRAIYAITGEDLPEKSEKKSRKEQGG